MTSPPKSHTDPPYTRMEILTARLADGLLVAALAFRACVEACYELDRRIAADRATAEQQARERFEACRAWLRQHPEVPRRG